jgi:hypothetical protein
MNNLLNFIFKALIGQAQACPMCMGNGPNDKYFFYVIISFIIFATIVILFLLKTCLKYKNINNKTLENEK